MSNSIDSIRIFYVVPLNSIVNSERIFIFFLVVFVSCAQTTILVNSTYRDIENKDREGKT